MLLLFFSSTWDCSARGVYYFLEKCGTNKVFRKSVKKKRFSEFSGRMARRTREASEGRARRKSLGTAP